MIPNANCSADVSLFVFVPSRPEAFYTRQKIRETWASNLTNQNIALRFVVGWPENRDVFDLLLQEFFQLDDLILYDIEDSYTNLYLKVYVAMQWQQVYCPNVDFVLKSDDDTVVDLVRLRWWIDNEFSHRAAKHPSAAFGGLWRGVRAIRNRDHKWFVPRQLYPLSNYPPYLNGPTYLLTNRAVSVILNVTEEANGFTIEDILYTGILANLAHVHKFSIWQHFRRGKFVYAHERCRIDKVDGHKVPYITAIYGISDPDKMHMAFEQLRSVGCYEWSPVRRTTWNSLFTE